MERISLLAISAPLIQRETLILICLSFLLIIYQRECIKRKFCLSCVYAGGWGDGKTLAYIVTITTMTTRRFSLFAWLTLCIVGKFVTLNISRNAPAPHPPKTEQILILKTNILEAHTHTYRAEWEEEGEKANAYHLTNMNRIQFSIVNINIIIANVVVATSVHHRASTFFHLCTWNCYLPHTHKHTRWANTYGTQPVQTT